MAMVFIVALLFSNCGTVPGYLADDDFQFQLQVQNDTYVDVTVYLLNSGSRQRLKRCVPIIPCNYFINPVTSADILRDGYVELGWQWASMPLGMLSGRLDMEVNQNMAFLLSFDQQRAWLRPGYVPIGRSADE